MLFHRFHAHFDDDFAVAHDTKLDVDSLVCLSAHTQHRQASKISCFAGKAWI
jgi:hypothetical protein